MSGERKGVCNEQFTPGPWKVDGDGIRALVRGSDLTIVATRHRLPGDIHQANAHLIAAAPDLYEALCALTGLLCQRDYIDTDDKLLATYSSGVAALAKAIGYQPSPAHGESEGGGE